MSQASIPPRPKLGLHVLARRHVIDGQCTVILFNEESDEVMRLGTREWEIVAAADGTRDVAGIALAARRRGADSSPDQVGEFLGRLAAAGLLADSDAAPPDYTHAALPADRPVRPLPGYRLRCDCSGRCCRMYATVMFSAEDVQRAQALLADRSIGEVRGDRAFLPVCGNVPGEVPYAVFANNGACGYLDGDGACAIHRAGGADAKPSGCSIFPAAFVDDGAAIRVSVKPECACVLASAGASDGDALVGASVTTAGDLSPATYVRTLPAAIAITAEQTVPRQAMVSWTQAWVDAPPAADPARACWAMADAIDDGLPAALRAWTSAEPAAPSAERIVPWVRSLAAHAVGRARVDARWRSARDRVRTVAEWVALTTATYATPELLDQLVAMPPRDAAAENFFVRASAYGYQVCDEDVGSVRRGLRDLAIKFWVARAMEDFAPEGETSLSALESWMRAYGGWKYILDG